MSRKFPRSIRCRKSSKYAMTMQQTRHGSSSEFSKPLQRKGILEPRARVELATCRLRIGCSTTELPRPLIIKDLFPCLRDLHQTFIVLPRFRRRVPQLSHGNARPVRSDAVLYRTAIATLPPPTHSL